MKFKVSIASLLLFSFYCLAEGKSFKLSTEYVSNKEIMINDKYELVREEAPGYDLLIVRFHEYPESLAYNFIVEKTLSKTNRKERNSVIGAMFKNLGRNIKEDVPCYIFLNRGFLRGEKVNYRVETHDQQVQETAELIPNPVPVKGALHGIEPFVELKGIKPTLYIITFKGMTKKETFQLESVSWKEKIVSESEIDSNTAIPFFPGVQGKEGGICYFSFKRKNGEKMTLELPWGKELIDQYLRENHLPPEMGKLWK